MRKMQDGVQDKLVTGRKDSISLSSETRKNINKLISEYNETARYEFVCLASYKLIPCPRGRVLISKL
jgi:hypothetical protein